jgi:Prasinovirus endonuclease VII
MICKFCDKKLRKDNKIGTCRKHRPMSDSRKSYMSVYGIENQDSLSSYKKEWAEINKNKLRNQYYERLRTDIDARLSHSLRTRVNLAIKRGSKGGSAVRDLGCSIEQLKIHLEKQFTSNMTWDNWALDGWHIDHIIPLSSFDLTDPEQFKIACHYTNLQPLWWRENIVKGGKIISQECQAIV